MELLFSYGTLQLDSVQKSSFGRLLKGEKTKLFGYRVEQVKITDSEVLKASGQEYHPIVFESNNDSDYVWLSKLKKAEIILKICLSKMYDLLKLIMEQSILL